MAVGVDRHQFHRRGLLSRVSRLSEQIAKVGEDASADTADRDVQRRLSGRAGAGDFGNRDIDDGLLRPYIDGERMIHVGINRPLGLVVCRLGSRINSG